MKHFFLFFLFGFSMALPKLPLSFSLTKEELLGKISVQNHPNFVRFVSGEKILYLRKEAYEALSLMREAAHRDGLSLSVISAFRSFEDQKHIWESKWRRLASFYPNPHTRCRTILRYSSAPGTSRHHWGTDVDLVSVDPAFFQTKKGKKILAWLETHAPHYGFERPYTHLSNRRGGYEEEPWHWSYRPLATNFLALYLTTVSLTDITGFEGAETLKEIDLWEYITGIAPSLLP
ncbi:MAG: M15 family metallopeptidase [Brevinematales bacterium]|nr:M15 family metallopeptidase [Brevinematales bacterium]